MTDTVAACHNICQLEVFKEMNIQRYKEKKKNFKKTVLGTPDNKKGHTY